jgi:hypothetical protein
MKGKKSAMGGLPVASMMKANPDTAGAAATKVVSGNPDVLSSAKKKTVPGAMGPASKPRSDRAAFKRGGKCD